MAVLALYLLKSSSNTGYQYDLSHNRTNLTIGANNYAYGIDTANPLTVTLSGQGNGIVMADAIRIVPDTATQTQNNTYFVHTDHLDTPRLITSYSNQKRWTWYPENSEAFGANLPNENPATLGVFTYNLRFPGQLYDPQSQLSYNYYRDYNPRTGRYIESDPIGLAGGINTYGYVEGNPLSYVDPRGLDVINLSNFPVKIRGEDWKPWYVPPQNTSNVSPDGVQNPVTGEWTKYRGKDFLPDNDVIVWPDGSTSCIRGVCKYLPESKGPKIDDTFGGSDSEFKEKAPGCK